MAISQVVKRIVAGIWDIPKTPTLPLWSQRDSQKVGKVCPVTERAGGCGICTNRKSLEGKRGL